jgi:O-antigen ligase
MGVTHANTLSFLSAILFWITFKNRRNKKAWILLPFRGFLLFIMVSAVSRFSIAAFLIGGLFYFLFRTIGNFRSWIMIFSGAGFLAAFLLLSFSFDQGWSKSISRYLLRGQSAQELTSFTGRTLIWQYSLEKAVESPIIGHGYGVTRFAIGTLPKVDYQPPHCHNDFLEVFLATGFLGLIPFLAFYLYGAKWILNYPRLCKVFSSDLALHAACIFAMVSFISLFESNLGGRLSPIQPLFFFYVLILDRESEFSRQLKRSETGPDRPSIWY